MVVRYRWKCRDAIPVIRLDLANIRVTLKIMVTFRMLLDIFLNGSITWLEWRVRTQFTYIRRHRFKLNSAHYLRPRISLYMDRILYLVKNHSHSRLNVYWDPSNVQLLLLQCGNYIFKHAHYTPEPQLAVAWWIHEDLSGYYDKKYTRIFLPSSSIPLLTPPFP